MTVLSFCSKCAYMCVCACLCMLQTLGLNSTGYYTSDLNFTRMCIQEAHFMFDDNYCCVETNIPPLVYPGQVHDTCFAFTWISSKIFSRLINWLTIILNSMSLLYYRNIDTTIIPVDRQTSCKQATSVTQRNMSNWVIQAFLNCRHFDMSQQKKHRCI